MIRDLWPYRTEWRKRLLERFLVTDLQKGPVLLLLEREGELARWVTVAYRCRELSLGERVDDAVVLFEVTGEVVR